MEHVARCRSIIGTVDTPMFIPGVEYVDWDLPDPSGQPIEFVRTVRDDIEEKVKQLISTL